MAIECHYLSFCEARTDAVMRFKEYLQRECKDRDAAMEEVLTTSLILQDMVRLQYDFTHKSADVVAFVRP